MLNSIYDSALYRCLCDITSNIRRLTICLLQSQKLKGTRQAKGSIAGARSSYTKKYSQASQRVKRANLALKARRGKR